MTSHPDLNGLTLDQQRELLAKLLQQRAAGERYPMSMGQQGLWHAFRRDPSSTAFNVFLPTRMRAAVSVSALRQSIQWLAARHVCLHTVFSDAGGDLMQIVKTGLQPEFSIIDLPQGTEEQARALVAAETLRPFDLEQGPLLRLLAVRLAEDDWIVQAVTHHIVVDFWSLILMLNELRQAYPHFAHQTRLRLPAAQNNYAQFVQDQRSMLASPLGDTHRSYWQSVIGQAAPVLELPCDKLRPPVFENAAISQLLEFPDALVPRINALATRRRATSVSVIHAAIQVFLARYSGQATFMIGSPFSGRGQHHYEQTVGFFINMLPLAVDLQQDPTFPELVSRTAHQLLDALEHQAYPIAQIVHDARLARDPSRTPLFQVSCTFEKSQLKAEAGRASFLFPNHQQVWDFGGLPQESFYIPHPTCHYDLEFVFEQTENRLSGMLVACQALFDSESLAAMARNFTGLLVNLLNSGDAPVSQVPWNDLASGRDSDRMRSHSACVSEPTSPSASGLSARSVIDGMTVCGLIAESVEKFPEQMAVQSGSYRLSYRELWNLAGHVAEQVKNYLRAEESTVASPPLAAAGGTPTQPTVIPVCTESGPLAFIGMLGVQLAGFTPAAIDLTQPSVTADSLRHDTSAGLWLGDSNASYASNMPATRIDLAELFELRTSLAETATNAWPAVSGAPGDAAYVVYTSGSTGKPKGVVVDHAAICNTLRWRKQAVPLTPDDRVLMLLSHQFDAALGIGWSGWTQGAALVWPEEGRVADPQRLLEQIIRDRITVLPAVPSLLSVLATHPLFSRCESLRLIFTGGEAMPAELPSQLRQVTAARLWNFYGPSEAAVEVTAADVTDHSPLRPVPIGRPIDNMRLLVVDAQRRPLPDTVPGELAIAGVGLARGYLHDPELTSRKFVPLASPVSTPGGSDSMNSETQPAWSPAGTRIYLTGDRGRQMPSGQFEFLGRLDHQIKLRGYRIELGEVEAALQSHPMVLRAAVKLHAPGTPQARLIGYVSLNTGCLSDRHAQQAAAIKRHASEQLAPYKVPTAIVIVDSMPLTSSGKVDRGRLPEYHLTETTDGEFVPAETELERFIAAAWRDNLQVESLSVDVSYFDAGGSSLGAALLTHQLSQELGIHVPTALLFDLADIRQVATRLAELHGPKLSEKFGPQAIEEQLARSQVTNYAAATTSGGLPMRSGRLHPLLAPLKATGTRPPIFMIHPPGGIVICYRDLARHLDVQQPLFAIRARGLHGQEALPESLAEMAADYLQAVHQVQPNGPYTLGGWSLGGLVAYEMAQQLLRSGQGVTRLLLLDTTIPEGATDAVPSNELVNVGREYGIELDLDQLGELSPAEQLPFLWEHAKGLGVIDDQSPPEVVARVIDDLRSLFHRHVELARQYQLQPIAADIDLFRPMQVPFELNVSPDRGWRYLARTVRVHHVPGHHHSMVQSPHAAHLAAAFNNLP